MRFNFNFKYNILYLFTGFTILGLCIFNHIWLAFHEVPEGNRELYIHATGMLDSAFISGLVATFFGSAKKDHDPSSTTTTSRTVEVKETPPDKDRDTVQ